MDNLYSTQWIHCTAFQELTSHLLTLTSQRWSQPQVRAADELFIKSPVCSGKCHMCSSGSWLCAPQHSFSLTSAAVLTASSIHQHVIQVQPTQNTGLKINITSLGFYQEPSVASLCGVPWAAVTCRETRMFCLLEYLFIVRKWKKRARGQVHKQSWERNETRQEARFFQKKPMDVCDAVCVGVIWDFTSSLLPGLCFYSPLRPPSCLLTVSVNSCSWLCTKILYFSFLLSFFIIPRMCAGHGTFLLRSPKSQVINRLM